MASTRIALASVLCFAAACGPATPPPAPPAPPAAPTPAPANADPEFGRVAAAFLARYLELFPAEATIQGEHRFDGTWPDWSAEGDDAVRALLDRTTKDLLAIDRASLSAQNRVDAATLENQIALKRFTLDAWKRAEVDPVAWTTLLADGIDPLLTREFAPAEARMRSLRDRLNGIPKVVAAARRRLGAPPKVHTETAIAQNKGLLAATSPAGIAEQLRRQKDLAPELRAEVTAAAATANAALKELDAFLTKELLPRSNGSFRLGKELFAKKLALTLDDDVDPEEVVRSARALMQETLHEMAKTAAEVWPLVAKGAPPADERALVAQTLAKLAEDRSTNATILADARKTLEDATKFVRAEDLVRVPDEPVRIVEMPEYRRGVAIAYCDSSGPLEKVQETFYSISPTPKDWPAARALSFYKEYNKSMLADLTVHEAMPGHYLQAMHQNRFASDVRAVFQDGAFVEGWAVYAEQVMSEHGFGGPKVKLQRQKMVLRMAANAILDSGIHAGALEEKDALALMMKDAFQEEGEAVGKWKRARLTSAQLTTYFHGWREMRKLRAAAETKPGFRERAYHDRLLSYGAPSFRYLRALMEDVVVQPSDRTRDVAAPAR